MESYDSIQAVVSRLWYEGVLTVDEVRRVLGDSTPMWSIVETSQMIDDECYRVGRGD